MSEAGPARAGEEGGPRPRLHRNVWAASATSFFTDVSSEMILNVLPLFLATAAGSYLFYAQHNYPTASYVDRREWNYHHAALHTSSMFNMSPVMHWFTANIGYHHVHHLNHRIPFIVCRRRWPAWSNFSRR